MNNRGNILTIFQSPHASTKKVAEFLGETFESSGYRCEYVDLKGTKTNECSNIVKKIIKNDYELVIIGTPVYLDHALRPVKDFIKSIPKLDKRVKAILFTTFGETSTGVAIPEMFKILKKRNFDIIGVVNVVSEHTLMFQGGNPLGKNRPNEDDFNLIESFAKNIIGKMEKGQDYNALKLSQMPKKPFWYKLMSLFVFRMNSLGRTFPEIVFNSEKCNKCGMCKTVCSSGILSQENISPGKSKECLKCYECVRCCPQNAVCAGLRDFEWKVLRKKRIVKEFETFNTEFLI